MRNKVYILNRGGHDYRAAEKFGEIVYCTEGTLSKYNTSQMLRECSAAMAESSAEDYILLTSLAILCSVACAHFAIKHECLNLLIFKDNDYVSRRLIFNNV